MKWIKRIVLGILLLLATYVLVALILSYIPTNPPDHSCQKSKTIFVASNGIHLDIYIPSIFMDEDFLNKIEAPFSAAYIGFGWGDKEFYVNTPEWGDLKIAVTARALFVPSQSVVHVGYSRNTYAHWVRVSICEHQLDKLLAYLEDQFEVNENGNFNGMPGYGPNDRFFDGNGRFMFYKTCNVWVNNGLKEAEIKTAVWSPFDFGVLYHLKKQRDDTG